VVVVVVLDQVEAPAQSSSLVVVLPLEEVQVCVQVKAEQGVQE
jgi:hypothetical protein